MTYIIVTDTHGRKVRVAVSAKVHQAIQKYDEIENAHSTELHGNWNLRLDGLPPDHVPQELQTASAEDSFFERLRQEICEQHVNNVRTFQEENRSALWHMLDDCTPLQKERFLLYIRDNLTLREIANMQKCSFIAVRNSIQTVLKKLQNRL